MDDELKERLTAIGLGHMVTDQALAELEHGELEDYAAWLRMVLARQVDYLPAEAQIPFALVEA